MVQAGIPVMAHIGFTPQSEHALGGYRVQGRGDDAQRLIDDAVALADAGAFCVLMEMVPAATRQPWMPPSPSPPSASAPATRPPARCWSGRTWRACAAAEMAKFVKQYADLRTSLSDAAKAYGEDVRSGQFPGPSTRSRPALLPGRRCRPDATAPLPGLQRHLILHGRCGQAASPRRQAGQPGQPDRRLPRPCWTPEAINQTEF